MRDIGFARRRPRKRANTGDECPCDPVTQDPSEQFSLSEQDYDKIEASQDAQLTRYQSPNPTTVLGAGQVDPFDAFPIPMDNDSHELVSHG